ncbi:unnamed protein product [Rhodiola kirilowii]
MLSDDYGVWTLFQNISFISLQKHIQFTIDGDPDDEPW